MEEINRLTRYLERETCGKIDYSKFLKQIEDVFYEKHTADDLTKFAKQITLHLRTKNLTILKFIKQI